MEEERIEGREGEGACVGLRLGLEMADLNKESVGFERDLQRDAIGEPGKEIVVGFRKIAAELQLGFTIECE